MVMVRSLRSDVKCPGAHWVGGWEKDTRLLKQPGSVEFLVSKRFLPTPHPRTYLGAPL